MTDKEFKRLSRSQLIEIIYQLQLNLDELTAENEKLSKALADKQLRLDKAGNIATAALEIHNVMKDAQDAAEHYLEAIQARVEEEYQQYLKEAEDQAAEIIAKARQEASGIVAQTGEEEPGSVPVAEPRPRKAARQEAAQKPAGKQPEAAGRRKKKKTAGFRLPRLFSGHTASTGKAQGKRRKHKKGTKALPTKQPASRKRRGGSDPRKKTGRSV